MHAVASSDVARAHTCAHARVLRVCADFAVHGGFGNIHLFIRNFKNALPCNIVLNQAVINMFEC